MSSLHPRGVVVIFLLACAGVPLSGSAAGTVPVLSRGAPLERSLREQDAHRYGVELAAGDHARVQITQRGAEVSVLLRAPSGQVVLETDTPADRNGTEMVSVIADAAGFYTVEILANELSEAAAGGYRIELVELRPATPEDRQRTDAEWTAARAFLLLRSARPEDLARALDLYGQALESWRNLGDRSQEAATLYGIGLVHYIGNRPAEAVTAFERSLELWRAVGDGRQQARALNQVGRTRRFLGDLPGAIAAFEEAIPLARSAGDLDQECTLLHNLAKLHVSRGNVPAAMTAYTLALELYRSRPDPAGEAMISNALGEVYEQQGRPTEALAHFERALELARGTNLNLEAEALGRLGALHQRLGQPHQALESFLPALDKYGEAHNFASQGLVLVSLGSLLADLGEPDQGEEILRRALPLLRDPRDQARTRLLLSRITRERGEAEAAFRLAEEALAAARHLEYPEGEAAALRSLGFLHLDRGEARQGRAALEESLRLFERIDHLAGQAETLRGLGQASSGLGDFAAADRLFDRALALARELGNAAEEARVLGEMSRSRQARGDLAAARAALEQSIDRLESLRSAIAGDDLRASHFAAQRQVYEDYVALLLQLDRTDPAAGWKGRAFEAAEKARARGLLDFLGQARVDLRQGDPALLVEESRLRLEMNARAALRTQRLRKPEKAAELEAIDRELTSLTTQYQLLEARLQAGSPGYAHLRQPEVALAEIQREVLDRETVLLEYFLAEPRSVLWLVTPESIASFELPGRTEIEDLARRVHERLGSPSPQGAAEERKDLSELSRILLGPVLDRIAGRRVAIAPDGALWYIPFAALPVPAGDGSGGSVPLVVEHEVVNVPSAAVLRQLRRLQGDRPRARGAVALVADPVFGKDDERLQATQASAPPPEPPSTGDFWTQLAGLTRQGAPGAALARLPWSRREAEAIAGEAAERQILLALDFQASRDLVTGPDLSSYRVVHFATHGILDTRHPQLSGLALSQVDERGRPREGFLRLHDIYQMRLSADLVVLSGCETALGRNLRGEGIVGLTHGFFHAGASQVVASLWPVRDRATAELMQRFYRGMFRDGLHPAAALRQAQIELWRERTWRDPYYWAAFVLQGDWREGG